MNIRTLASAIGAAACLLPAVPLQAAHDEVPARGALLPHVLVIAPEWREVELHRTPGVADSLSAEQLAASGTHNTIDLQYLVPGFVFKTNSVLGQPYLRGVGSDIVSAGSESSVATFIDGVYLPRAFDTIVDFFDVERVEVLKGPQGVHLGRNVVGGAVSVHTRDPGSGGYADLLLGDHGQRQLRGAMDLPLGARVVARVAGLVSRRDGYTDNVFLGVGENDENHRAVRGKLLFSATERFSARLGIEHYDEDSSRALGSQPRIGIGRNGGIEMGGTVPADPRQVTEDVAPEIRLQATRVDARLDWRVAGLDLRSTTAFLSTDARLALDLDGTQASYAANYPSADSESWQQEFRASSAADHAWSWVGGAFFLSEDTRQVLDVDMPASGTRNTPDARVETRATAVFGQLAWRFAPGWRARAGLRYSQDHRELDLIRTLITPAGTTVNRQVASRRWDALTPELGLEYAPREDRLVWMTVSRGYKPGGYNTSVIQPAFDAEDLWAYEGGIKAWLEPLRLQLSSSLFRYDYRDMQLTTLPPDGPPGSFPSVMNAARSTVQGVELSLDFLPSERLEAGLSLTLLDAAFDRFSSVDRNNPQAEADRAGNRLPQAPSVSLNARIDRHFPLAGGRVTAGADLHYRSSVWFNVYEDPAVRQGEFGLLNLRLAFADHRNEWYAEAWLRNLTDRLYAQTIVRDDPRTGTKRHWGAPRSFGIRVGRRF